MYDILPKNLPLLVTIPMKSYDDLQRFKEKTQTNHIEFKDMSEQTKHSDSANWAIITQLMNDPAAPILGNGQTINVAAPQPITDDAFSLDTAPLASRPYTSSPVAAFVAARPADVGRRSLLDNISASLKPVETSIPSAGSDEPRQEPADILTQLQKSDPQTLTPLPVAPPVSLSVPSASPHTEQTEAPRFRQLFSTESEARSLSKDTLLQPLLEKIASCR